MRAIAGALLVRARNAPGMRLRYVEDGSMEDWEVTVAAANVARRAVEEWRGREESSDDLAEYDEDEIAQVFAGRVMAVLVRLDQLEVDLLNRCCMCDSCTPDDFFSLGVPGNEIKAWLSTGERDDSTERIIDAAAAIDAACLFDESLRNNRARSLLAMFLHEIEGPGLRRNNAIVPCMDVDFLSDDEWAILFGSKNNVEEMDDSQSSIAAVGASEVVSNGNGSRPSLHPITIDAIEEAFRLRSRNMTTSPLRLIDEQTEWYDVQYSIVKFADRFLERYTKRDDGGIGADDESRWTAEELQTIGGRIVGVLMRLDDLEWEWNDRVCASPLADSDSPSMIPHRLWKTALGLHPNDVEQSRISTLDAALSTEGDFARTRAERMLALFLLNVEGPGVEASGREMPGGSHPDFIHDPMQMKLMMPRSRI
jgi:hypothetical protein